MKRSTNKLRKPMSVIHTNITVAGRRGYCRYSNLYEQNCVSREQPFTRFGRNIYNNVTQNIKASLSLVEITTVEFREHERLLTPQEWIE